MKRFDEMTVDELKENASGCYDAIYNADSYGVHDVLILDGCLAELSSRGIEATTSGSLVFDDMEE